MSEDKPSEKDISASKFFEKNPPEPTNTHSSLIAGKNESSSSSVKLKKSSNIFSSLVRKARRKKIPSKSGKDDIKSLHISSQNLSGSSTLSLSVHMEEIEISCQNYDKKCNQIQGKLLEEGGVCSEANTSNHSLAFSTKQPGHIYALPAIQDASQSNNPEIAQTTKNRSNSTCHFSQSKETTAENIEGNSKEYSLISSFVPFEKPTLNVTLADALQYVQETVNSLHENESYIINLLNKYIRDSHVQKQLTSAVCYHSKLQWEAERRSCSLANDMWMQQLEIGRAEEKILQGTLSSLVKQNRQLQIENESLYRKHEKALKMLRGYETRPRSHEHDAQIDSILRHNEKLQVKLETVFKKCECLEGELIIFQKQNDNMEQQLRNCTVKMQNLKATNYKMKTEYELDQAALNFKLETKEQILKDALEAGDVVLEDLDGLKRQLKSVPVVLSWSKFKVRGNCLTDLVHMCRSCINDLSKELVGSHNEIILKEKDIATLRETNTKLQESLKKSTTELDIMAKKIEESSAESNYRLLSEQKCRMLEKDLRASDEKMEQLKFQHEAEIATLKQSIVDSENYKREIKERDQMIEQTKLFVANITSENYALKNDIAMLNQFLQETGAGDVVRRIKDSEEELEYFNKELKKFQKENQTLKTELETVKNENGALTANQESSYKNIQKHNKDLEKANEEILTLRQKFEAEHQTVLSLQNERMKYLDEKNILKSVIQHLKNELSKIKQLEDNLSNVTKEASKLGMVAEYNKQQGEKLKKEVIERDAIITKLKSTLQKLNELQMQNTKEKLALCYELNEVCQLKEKLSEVLDTEVKKNAELGQSNEAIVKSVNNQIQKIEEKQKNERTAIRILLKDIKIIAEEKEQLTKEKDRLRLEVEQLNIKFVEQGKKYEELTKERVKKDEEITELKKARDLFEKKQQEINENFEKAESKYDMNLQQLRKLIEQLRKDKKDLVESNEYLKTNIGKLHQDLNASKQSEQATDHSLSKTKQQQEETQKVLTEQTESIKNLTKEKEALAEEKKKLTDDNNRLIKETNYLNTILDKVVNDFEKCIKSSEEKERLFKSEFDESKKLIHTYAQEIQDLNKTIDLKEKKIEELNDLAKGEHFQQKRYVKLKGEMETLEIEHGKLKETRTHLESQINDLQEEYEKSSRHLKNLAKESQVLENQLKIVLDQKEEDYVFYKKHIADLLRTHDEIENQNQKEIHTLKQQLQEASKKIVNEKAAYETLSQIHKEVSGKFMKSIKDLVDVKNSKQEIVEKLKENQEMINGLENEKNELNKQINKLTDELNMSKHMVIQLNEENNLLQKSYNKALEKCVTFEYEVKRLELSHHHVTKELKDMDLCEHDSNLQQEIDNSKRELEETSATIHRLKMEISALQQEITRLQIERSEITMELHETKKKYETERNLSEQLKNTHKLLLAALLQLKEEGKVDPADCIHLLHMVRSTSNVSSVDGGTSEKF